MDPVLLDYPFRGRWRTQNSPARRIPSHGTHLFGTTYAIDFVPVDAAGRSAPYTWRTWLGTEPPENFVGFGMPILAPVTGEVVLVHDGEPDVGARRTVIPQLAFLTGQARRARAGWQALTGNAVVIAIGDESRRPGQGDGDGGPFVVLAHLRCGSAVVSVGERVAVGQQVAECGNSGNTTEPHLHLQVNNSLDFTRMRGVPLRFHHAGKPHLPNENEIVEA